MKAQAKTKILLILTGGTICSFADSSGERVSDTKKAETLIVSNFRESDSEYRSEERVFFDARFPLDILSENMTAAHWNTLVNALKSYSFDDYDGVIILHGTDTLAYTASLLSLLLAGIKIPVFLISSQLPIYMKEANGNENFRAAAELIANGIAPNVYAIYRNSETINGKETKTTYLHYAAHLLQCASHSDNFYSQDMMPTEAWRTAKPCGYEGEMPLYSINSLSSGVLRLEPYVGIDYSHYRLKRVNAVLHGTYHSCTAAARVYKDGTKRPDKKSSHSLLWLIAKCKRRGIPLFLSPCDKNAYDYETTGELLRNGAKAIYGMTDEMTYAKLLVGVSLGYKGVALEKYLGESLCGEFIYSKR